MKKSQLIIIALILIVLVGLVCFKLGLVAGKNLLEPTAAQYKKIIDYYFPALEETFNVSGKITEIQDNVLSIKTIVQNSYILPEEWELKIVKAIVTNETEIVKFDMNTGKEIELNLADLKVENEVSIRANENIKDKNEFEAAYISLFLK